LPQGIPRRGGHTLAGAHETLGAAHFPAAPGRRRPLVARGSARHRAALFLPGVARPARAVLALRAVGAARVLDLGRPHSPDPDPSPPLPPGARRLAATGRAPPGGGWGDPRLSPLRRRLPHVSGGPAE